MARRRALIYFPPRETRTPSRNANLSLAKREATIAPHGKIFNRCPEAEAIQLSLDLKNRSREWQDEIEVNHCKHCGGLLRKHPPPKRAIWQRSILKCSRCGKFVGLAPEGGER